MLIGNTEAQKLMRSYVDIFLAGKNTAPSFYILAGPEHIGKSSFVLELIREYLGDFFYNDFLHIKDFSQELGKKHAIKVELDKGEIMKTLASEYQYQDLGIREISQWLQQSYIGKMKVVLLENIERLTPGAANAFLKTCEEPLKNRLIIATTSHASQIIDTIISRALVIHFNELSPTDLLSFADEHKMFNENQELKELVCNMAMGKPGMLIQLQTLLSENAQVQEQFLQIIPLLLEKKQLFKAHDILKNFKKNGIWESFLDGRIAYCTMHDLPHQAKQRLKIKRMMRTNVGVENLMLYGLLEENV